MWKLRTLVADLKEVRNTHLLSFMLLIIAWETS